MAIKFLNNVAVDSDVLYVDTINNRVGIGTTSPQGLLHISSDSTPTLIIGTKTANQANSGAISFREIESTSEVELRYNGADNAFKIWTSLAGDALTVLRSNANVGIGTTSPNRTFTVASDDFAIAEFSRNTAGGGAAIVLQDGNDSEYELINGVSNFQIRSNFTDTQFHITRSTGNVGIGTTSPDSKLEVASTSSSPTYIHVRNDSTGSTRLKMSNSSDINSNGFQIINNSSNGQVNLLNYKASTLALWTNALQRVAINSSGNVGIGTASPVQKLSVAPSTDVSGEFGYAHVGNVGYSGYAGFSHVNLNSPGNYALLHQSTGTTYLNASSGQSIRFRINNFDKMLLDSSGNVGIGTTSPGAKLDVSGGDIRLSTNATYLRSKDSASAFPRVLGMNAANTFYIGPIDSYAGGPIVYGVSSNVSYHGFYGGGSEKVRITSTGNVGIGTTSPANKLNVVGDIGYTGVIGQGSIYGNPGNSSYATMQLYNGSNGYTTLNNQSFGYYFNTGGSNKLTILNSGNVGIGTTNPTAKLTVVDDILLTGSSPSLTLTDATSSFVVATNTAGEGIIKTSADKNIRFFRNDSTETMRIAATTGNVGIGTTSPSYKLHVAGNSFIDATSASAALTLGRYSGQPTIKAGTDDGGYIIIDSSGGMAALNWYSSNNVALANGGGNVGIGTTSPSQKLDVVGSIEVSDGIYIGGTAAANKLDDYEQGTFDLEWGYGVFGGISYYNLSDFGGNKSETSTYVKVGRHVTVTSVFRYGSLPTAWSQSSGVVYLKLPFAVSTGYYANGAYSAFPGSSAAGSPSLFPTNYSSAFSLLGLHKSGFGGFGTFLTLTVGDMPGIGPSGYAEFKISFSFYTTS